MYICTWEWFWTLKIMKQKVDYCSLGIIVLMNWNAMAFMSLGRSNLKILFTLNEIKGKKNPMSKDMGLDKISLTCIGVKTDSNTGVLFSRGMI